MELSTSTNILFERRDGELIPQEKVIRLCAEAGYTILDFCFHDLITYESPLKTDSWEDYFHFIKKVAADCNIRFQQGHAIVYDFCRTDIDHQLYDELFRRCIVGANILGIKWLVVHPSTVRDEVLFKAKSKRKNIEFFQKWVTVAKDYQVSFAVENMWDLHIQPIRQYCVEVEELIELVDAVPGLGACWDCEHAEIMQIDQGQALEALGHRLKALHISDYTNEKDIHLLPYLGNSNWDAIFTALRNIQYDGVFNFEIHKYLVNMPHELIPEAMKFSVSIGQYMIEQIKRGGN
ncbi:sugar phosphate isomerase/epimerase [Streptococcus sp. ZJ93]|uniref:sugar phosphate isomerase/epimerase family protein n=1 Tax=Streptococcus handemini TaxID=3161188 RepID=UPI0032EBB397